MRVRIWHSVLEILNWLYVEYVSASCVWLLFIPWHLHLSHNAVFSVGGGGHHNYMFSLGGGGGGGGGGSP